MYTGVLLQLAALVALVTLAAGWHTAARSQTPSPQGDLSGYTAKPLEIPLLPRYCWATFNEKFRAAGSEFHVPRSCGNNFGHFCPGLLSLARAKSSVADPGKRGYWAGVAADHFRYTAGRMVPGCPLRPELETAMREAAAIRGTQR